MKKNVIVYRYTSHVSEIRRGNRAFLVINDLRKKRPRGHYCFLLNDDSVLYGKPAYEAALRRIARQKGFFARLTRSELQYELYDWEHYQRVVK